MHKDRISDDDMPSYPKHYDISREETQEGKAEMREKAYSGDNCKQNDKAMPDL